MGESDKILIISFSGGRTSAYMTWRLLKEWGHKYKTIYVVFANTGQEHEYTLRFINLCDIVFGFNTVWIEAVVDPEKGKGTSFRVVNHNSASRNGEPFEDVVAKYGIPFSKSPHCTRDLKEYPIKAYIRSLGLKNGDYDMAIGIRADEMDRVNLNGMDNKGLIYPLVEWGIKKQDVLDWWSQQEFDLEIPEHLGNCVWCWKKSFKKLATVYREHPEFFDFPRRLEQEYARSGAVAKKLGKDIKPFRGWKGVDYIEELAASDIESYTDDWWEAQGGCGGESCEVFTSDGSEEILDGR
jgi:hypothetical protein